jgi:hypothetical protein
MARDLAREARLPEPYRTEVSRYLNAAGGHLVRHSMVYETAEGLVRGGGVLPDGFTMTDFFRSLREIVEERKAARVRRQKAERVEKREALRLSAGVEIDPYGGRMSRYRGKNVWLFHGTTTCFLRSMRLHGLSGELRRTDARGSLTRDVYVTALPGDEPCGAARYASAAVYAHGGDRLVVRVLVPFDELRYDPDDADISCGKFQWIVRVVPASAIYSMSGKPLFRLPARP